MFFLWIFSLEVADFPIALLPQVISVGQHIGELQHDFCGLAKGIQVYVSSGDAQSSVASTGFGSHQAGELPHLFLVRCEICGSLIELL